MDRIKSAINKIWSYELSHMFVYSVIINIKASWFPSFRALTKAWASSCEYFWDILIILNMKIKSLLYQVLIFKYINSF